MNEINSKITIMFFLLLDWRLKHTLHVSGEFSLRPVKQIYRINFAEKVIFGLPPHFGLK